MNTTTVRLWLRVENNSKFIRGKKRARQDIEDFHLRRFGMKKLNEREYEMTFSYADDADLDRQVYRLMQDMDLEADLQHCFTEAGVREIGAD